LYVPAPPAHCQNLNQYKRLIDFLYLAYIEDWVIFTRINSPSFDFNLVCSALGPKGGAARRCHMACACQKESPMKNFLKKFRKGESGATAIEYGLIAALIAVVLISSLTRLGNNMGTRFNSIGNSVGSR
jgi:pilus assembly protein Flp/PilA